MKSSYFQKTFRILLFNRVALKAEVVEDLQRLKSNLKMKSFRITSGLSLIRNFSNSDLAAGSNYIYPDHVTAIIILHCLLKISVYKKKKAPWANRLAHMSCGPIFRLKAPWTPCIQQKTWDPDRDFANVQSFSFMAIIIKCLNAILFYNHRQCQ